MNPEFWVAVVAVIITILLFWKSGLLKKKDEEQKLRDTILLMTKSQEDMNKNMDKKADIHAVNGQYENIMRELTGLTTIEKNNGAKIERLRESTADDFKLVGIRIGKEVNGIRNKISSEIKEVNGKISNEIKDVYSSINKLPN